MNRKEQIVCKILEFLHNTEDGQCAENILKSSIDLLVKPNTLLTEFRDALAWGEQNNWIIGIRPRLGAVKWSITDLGRAEHLKG